MIPKGRALKRFDGYSMNDVYFGLERLATGKWILPDRMTLLCCWFDLPFVNQYMAKQILSQLRRGVKKVHVRFPRRKP